MYNVTGHKTLAFVQNQSYSIFNLGNGKLGWDLNVWIEFGIIKDGNIQLGL